jgi:hypothetical protein
VDAVGRLVRDGVAVGTAFVLTADGLAATAEHVVGSCREANWTFEPLAAPGLSLPVDLSLPADADSDVALLQVVTADGWEPMTLASHLDVSHGAQVHLRGFARSLDFDSGVGQYVGEMGERGRVWVKVSCRHAQPGMSGAPVLVTGTGSVLGVVSARLNADRWNRDSVLLAPAGDVVALAPERLGLVHPTHRPVGGTLRLSWDRQGAQDLIVETDDFNVSFGRNTTNRVCLPDSRDSRFHGALGMDGPALVYRHFGTRPTFLVGATRQLRIGSGESCPVHDTDRLRFASGVVLVQFSVPDLFDPNAGPTADGEDAGGGD